MINFLIYHHSQKYSFTRRPNTQLYMQFACYRKQKIKKFINPQSRQQQNASPSPYHPIGTTSHIPTPQNTTTNQQPPVTTTKNSFKKKPEGCAEGPWLYGPFAVFIFPKKNISSNKQIFFFRLFLNTFIQTLQKIQQLFSCFYHKKGVSYKNQL